MNVADAPDEPSRPEPGGRPSSRAVVESRLTNLHRALYRRWGRAGPSGAITLVALVSSVTMTAVYQSLLDYTPELHRQGLGIAVAVTLTVAPPLAMLFGLLSANLLALEAQLKDQAMRDALTGVPNRRWILERGAQAIARGAAPASAFGVLMVDVDHFKSINDRLGHAAGDAVLREVATRLGARLRRTDRFGRYGGEEFLVVTEDRDPDSLRAAAEAIRQTLAQASLVADGIAIPITVSVGGALHPAGSPTRTFETTLRRADAALYRAKAAGRDRVEIAPPDADQRSG